MLDDAEKALKKSGLRPDQSYDYTDIITKARESLEGRKLNIPDKEIKKLFDQILSSADEAAELGEDLKKLQAAEDAIKVAEKAAKTTGRAARIVKVGGKIIGVVAVVYSAGEFVYYFYNYDYDGGFFERMVYAGNKMLTIPFTPEWEISEAIFNPNYFTEKSIQSLIGKINLIENCLKVYDGSGGCYYEYSFLGQKSTTLIDTEKEAEELREDMKHYERLPEERFSELK